MSTKFYLPKYLAAEHEVAAYLARLLRQGCDKVTPVLDGLGKRQPEAVEMACQHPVSIICGPPGTGKTTTLQRVCDSFQQACMTIKLMCPTGKGAKRADEVINQGEGGRREVPIECSTIHRGLQYDFRIGGFQINRHNPLNCDVLIIEEFSMLGLMLARDTLSSVNPQKTRVVFCGDWHQLPSVEPGNTARDMILSDVIPKVELDHIFRTGPNSGVAFNATQILNGEDVVKVDPRTGEKFEDFYFVPRNNEEQTVEWILENVAAKIPEVRGYDSLYDIQVLSPGKRTQAGTKSLNEKLREKLNSRGDGSVYKGFWENDKIINRQNNYKYDIVNGDVGVISSIKKDDIIMKFAEGAGPSGDGWVQMPKSDFNNIFLSYCNTIHTSQGSEYKVVIIPVHRGHYRLLFRELIYTGITRAKELAVVVGDPSAFARCIANNVTAKRNTNLQSIIRKLAS